MPKNYTHLKLPYYEAKSLLEDKNIFWITIRIDPEKVKCERLYNQKDSDPLFAFHFDEDTEPQYPSIEYPPYYIVDQNGKKVPNPHARVGKIIYAARFWNYAGDGTHHSIDIYPLAKEGEYLKVDCSTNSNMFDHLIVKVEKLKLIRNEDNSWSWLLGLKNTSN